MRTSSRPARCRCDRRRRCRSSGRRARGPAARPWRRPARGPASGGRLRGCSSEARSPGPAKLVRPEGEHGLPRVLRRMQAAEVRGEAPELRLRGRTDPRWPWARTTPSTRAQSTCWLRETNARFRAKRGSRRRAGGVGSGSVRCSQTCRRSSRSRHRRRHRAPRRRRPASRRPGSETDRLRRGSESRGRQPGCRAPRRTDRRHRSRCRRRRHSATGRRTVLVARRGSCAVVRGLVGGVTLVVRLVGRLAVVRPTGCAVVGLTRIVCGRIVGDRCFRSGILGGRVFGDRGICGLRLFRGRGSRLGCRGAVVDEARGLVACAGREGRAREEESCEREARREAALREAAPLARRLGGLRLVDGTGLRIVPAESPQGPAAKVKSTRRIRSRQELLCGIAFAPVVGRRGRHSGADHFRRHPLPQYGLIERSGDRGAGHPPSGAKAAHRGRIPTEGDSPPSN